VYAPGEQASILMQANSLQRDLECYEDDGLDTVEIEYWFTYHPVALTFGQYVNHPLKKCKMYYYYNSFTSAGA